MIMNTKKAAIAGMLSQNLHHLESEYEKMREIKNDPTAIGVFRERYFKKGKSDLRIQNIAYCSNNTYMKRVAVETYKFFMQELEKEIQKCKSDINDL